MSSRTSIPINRDFAGDRMLKQLGDLDLDPDETPPQTIKQYRDEIKDINEYAEEMRGDLEYRKQAVKEHKVKNAKYREQIKKLQEELAKEKEQGKLLKDEIKTIKDTDTELSRKIEDFNFLQAEVKQLKDKVKGLKSKLMEERQKANIAKGKKPKPDLEKELYALYLKSFAEDSSTS